MSFIVFSQPGGDLNIHCNRYVKLFILLLVLPVCATAAIDITIDATAGLKPISPYIYGRNNNFSDNPASPTAAAQIALYNEAGLRFSRDNGGNNSTKWNWRKKLSSHPDWYNNVYKHDWAAAALEIQNRAPLVSGLFALQLLGKAARTDSANFDCWSYNQCAGGSTSENWAGNGDIRKYLEDWPADSAVGVFSDWFSPVNVGGRGVDSTRFRFWNMDNEPEAWSSTHDDALPDTISAESYMQKYFAVAKAARARFPGVKLVGPVFTNEWQWWAWNNHTIPYTDGTVIRNFPWVEYFIKRISEEQTATGIRLLDVIDFHFYPGANNDHDISQVYRVWFDTTYDYPGANGCRQASGNWDNNQKKEFVMERCRRWLSKYMGADNHVGFSVSEHGDLSGSSSAVAVWHASMLGTFADQGVTIFTPWNWYPGDWEVLHLFSRYAKPFRTLASSDDDTLVSAYSSVNAAGDSLTCILVNRDAAPQTVTMTFNHFFAHPGTTTLLQIANLPAAETFVSHTNNALSSTTVPVTAHSANLTLPSLSVTALILKNDSAGVSIVNKQSSGTIQRNLSSGLHITIDRLHLLDIRQNGCPFSIYTISGRCIFTSQNNDQTGRSQTVIPARITDGIYYVRYFYTK